MGFFVISILRDFVIKDLYFRFVRVRRFVDEGYG